MTKEKYCWQQALLHWLSAIVILWALASGFAVSMLDLDPLIIERLVRFNTTLSVLFIPVFILRCYVRAVAPAPSDINGEGWKALLAHFKHLGMYTLTALVLLSGILMMDRDIDMWLFMLEPMLADHFWRDLWFEVHGSSSVLLAALVLVHLVAVLRHELLGRRILRRMLP